MVQACKLCVALATRLAHRWPEQLVGGNPSKLFSPAANALSPAPALICTIYLQAPIQWDVQHIGKEVDPRTNSFVTRENLDSVLVRTRPLPLALGSVHCATSCWNGRGCTRLARAACS